MMNIWRKTGVDKLLLRACRQGIVLSGVSAGAICWFSWGNSDSRRFANPKADLIKVSGLGLIKALGCPHYDKDRRVDLKKMAKRTPAKRTPGIAIAIGNCCALEIVGDTYRIISSKNSANAYRVYWKNNQYREEVIEKVKDFRRLEDLLKK